MWRRYPESLLVHCKNEKLGLLFELIAFCDSLNELCKFGHALETVAKHCT